MLNLTNVTTMIGEHQVIHDVSLHIAQGDFVALLGGNGAGKTSLFRTIVGVLPPAKGKIEFKGEEISHIAAHKIVGKGIALCPEGRQLFPQLSVKKNLMLGAYHRKDKKGIEESLEQVYALFPRLKERYKQMAGTFSGGEQQMLAISRALMSRPRLLLLDEPSLGLAPILVDALMDTILRIRSEGVTVLLVEQNAARALEIADRGYILDAGRFVKSGPGPELAEDPEIRRAYLGG